MRLKLSGFWIGLLGILALAGALRLLIFQFSLPYVDHPDEPNYYLGGLEWRGLYDNQDYFRNGPPGYVALNMLAQPVLEAVGISGLAETVEALRLLSIMLNLLTLVLIALTARMGGGDLAGLTAGLGWGIAYPVLDNSFYALPDPFVYLSTALALWLALVALEQLARRSWAVWSVVVALVGVVIKFPALPALLPGVVVGLVIWWHDPRRGWRLLAVQIALIVGVALWLIYGYGIDFDNLKGPGAVVRRDGWNNLFDMGRLANNLWQTIVPLGAVAFVIIAALGVAAYVVALRRGLARVRLSVVLFSLSLVISVPWLTNTYTRVDWTAYRFVLPGTTAACVLLGLGLSQLATVLREFLPQPRETGLPAGHLGWSAAVVVLPLAALVWWPQLTADWRLVQDHRLPDRRVELRRWFDASLDPGTVIVDHENHKTFNPFWGGIPYRHWVDWWITGDITEHTVEEWREERGMSYAAIPRAWLETLSATPEGQAYLAQLLPLRDFTAPPRARGPEFVFYRLWRMQHEVDVAFGQSIRLTGYDLSAQTARPGDNLRLRFYWNAMATPEDNYSLFLHVVPLDTYTVLAQSDNAPATAARPTLTWSDPSETLISPPFEITLPGDLAPGDYRVMIGLYNYVTGVRLPVSTGGDSYLLATIAVQS